MHHFRSDGGTKAHNHGTRPRRHVITEVERVVDAVAVTGASAPVNRCQAQHARHRQPTVRAGKQVDAYEGHRGRRYPRPVPPAPRPSDAVETSTRPSLRTPFTRERNGRSSLARVAAIRESGGRLERRRCRVGRRERRGRRRRCGGSLASRRTCGRRRRCRCPSCRCRWRSAASSAGLTSGRTPSCRAATRRRARRARRSCSTRRAAARCRGARAHCLMSLRVSFAVTPPTTSRTPCNSPELQ